MFNRQPFNKGKFSTSATRHRSIYFHGSANSSLEAAGGVIAVRAFNGSADDSLFAGGKLNLINALKGSADVVLFADCKLNVVRDLKGNADSHVFAGGNVIRARNIGDTFDIIVNSGFNRLHFNRGKLNALSYKNSKTIFNLGVFGNMNTVSTFRGNTDIVLLMDGRANVINAFRGEAELYLHVDGIINVILLFKGSIDTVLSASGRVNVIKDLKGVAAIILEITNKGFNTYRYEYIKLPDIVIKPGDELIINTDDMTVMLNGQNVIQYLSRDSEFFLFNPHENDITYTSGNTSDKVDIKILWKDAFL